MDLSSELSYEASTRISGKKKERFTCGVACRTLGNARFFSGEPNLLNTRKLFDKLGFVSAAYFGNRVRCYGVSPGGVARLSQIGPLKEALEFLTGPCALTVEMVNNIVLVDSTTKKTANLDTHKIEQALIVVARLLDESQTHALSREVPYRKVYVRAGLGGGLGICVLWSLAFFTASDRYFAFLPLLLPSLGGFLLWAVLCFLGAAVLFKKHPMGRNIVVCLTLGSLGGGVYAGAGFAVLANSWLPSPSQTVTVPGALHIFHGTKNTVYSVHVDKGAIPVIYGEQLSYAPMSAKKYREIATRLGGSGSQSDSTHGRFEVRVNRGFFNVPFISDVKPVGP